jgi:hypothetical protein
MLDITLLMFRLVPMTMNTYSYMAPEVVWGTGYGYKVPYKDKEPIVRIIS